MDNDNNIKWNYPCIMFGMYVFSVFQLWPLLWSSHSSLSENHFPCIPDLSYSRFLNYVFCPQVFSRHHFMFSNFWKTFMLDVLTPHKFYADQNGYQMTLIQSSVSYFMVSLPLLYVQSVTNSCWVFTFSSMCSKPISFHHPISSLGQTLLGSYLDDGAINTFRDTMLSINDISGGNPIYLTSQIITAAVIETGFRVLELYLSSFIFPKCPLK